MTEGSEGRETEKKKCESEQGTSDSIKEALTQDLTSNNNESMNDY